MPRPFRRSTNAAALAGQASGWWSECQIVCATPPLLAVDRVAAGRAGRDGDAALETLDRADIGEGGRWRAGLPGAPGGGPRSSVGGRHHRRRRRPQRRQEQGHGEPRSASRRHDFIPPAAMTSPDSTRTGGVSTQTTTGRTVHQALSVKLPGRRTRVERWLTATERSPSPGPLPADAGRGGSCFGPLPPMKWGRGVGDIILSSGARGAPSSFDGLRTRMSVRCEAGAS
jgi:hypothetical protein